MPQKHRPSHSQPEIKEDEEVEYNEDFFKGLEQDGMGDMVGGGGGGTSSNTAFMSDVGLNLYASSAIGMDLNHSVGLDAMGQSFSQMNVGPVKKKRPSSAAAGTAPGINASLVTMNRLPFRGRQDEIISISKAVERISLEWMENPAEVLWISGPLGVGKTTLFKEASDVASSSSSSAVPSVFQKVFMCGTSCEDPPASAHPATTLASVRASGRPFQVVSDCLNDLCRTLSDKGGKALWKERLEEALGGEGPMLGILVPQLLPLLEIPPMDRRSQLNFDANTPKRKQRLMFAVRDLLQAVSEYHPLVLKVDNFEYVDPDSLQILMDLVTSKPIQNFLLVAIHDTLPTGQEPPDASAMTSMGEPKPLHPVRVLRAKLEDYDMVRTTDLVLEPLSLKAVEDMLTAMLLNGAEAYDHNTEGSLSDIHGLAEIVHALSKGNGLWLLQLMRYFNDLKLMTYADNKWEWNRKKIKKEVKRWREEGEACFGSLDGLIQTRLEKLPKKILFAAQVFGTLHARTFHLDQMDQVCIAAFLKEKKSDKELISSAEELKKMVVKGCHAGIFKATANPMCFRFSHERVGDCAALTVPETDRKAMSFRIGTELSNRCMESKGEERERFKFWSVDQLNGCGSLMDERELAKLAKLNLEAAEIAITKSAFDTALAYLETSISTLDIIARWQPANYAVTLRSFLLLARVRLCCGRSASAIAACEAIMDNATTLKDKVLANQILVVVLMADGKHKKALDQILELLRKLGEVFPEGDKVGDIVEREISNLRKRMEKVTNQELLNPPKMTDKKSADILLLLASLVEAARGAGEAGLIELATIRMMHLSLAGGFTRQYPLSFALFGTSLITRGLVKEAHRVGQVAEKIARVTDFYGGEAVTMFHANISHWKRTYKRVLEPVLRIYNAQVDVGDFHHVDYSIHTYIQYHLASGFDLTKLNDNLQVFDELYTDYDIENDWHILMPQQLVNNLLGETENPLLFFGDTFTHQEARLEQLEDSGLHEAVEYCNLLRLFIAFFFHDYETMQHCFERIETAPSGVWVPWLVFFECYLLIQDLEGSKGKSRKELKERIDTLRNRLTDWYNQGSPNPNAMTSILEAEWTVAKESSKGLSAMKAQDLYNEAMNAAATDGATHLEAFAAERAGMHFDKIGVAGFCAEFLAKSHKIYDKCQYVAKVVDLESRYADKLQISKVRVVAAQAYLQQNAAANPSQERTLTSSHAEPVGMTKVLKSAAKGLRKGRLKKTSRKIKSIFKKDKGGDTAAAAAAANNNNNNSMSWGWGSKNQLAMNESFSGAPTSPKPLSARLGFTSPRKGEASPGVKSPTSANNKSPGKARMAIRNMFGKKSQLPLNDDDDEAPQPEETINEDEALDEAVEGHPIVEELQFEEEEEAEDEEREEREKKSKKKKKKKKSKESSVDV